MGARGQLTDELKTLAAKVGLPDITRTELRLLPYIQFCLMNERRVDPRKINQEERDILQKWRDAGYLDGGAGEMTITKQFWDALNELVWLAYVAFDYEVIEEKEQANA